MCRLEKLIINDILSNNNFSNTINNTSNDNLISLHFQIGTYIRNKFLWNNPKNVIILSKTESKCGDWRKQSAQSKEDDVDICGSERQ